MNPPYSLKTFSDIVSLAARYSLLRQLNPNLSEDRYRQLLIPIVEQGNYFQIGCFEGERCVGLSGVWIGTKIWCGKYIEVDNFVVDAEYRGRGIGKLILDWIENYGRETGCERVHLDSYIANERANRFYTDQGFTALGYHMTKPLSP